MKRTDLDSEVLRVALSLSPNIGAKTINSLLQHFDQDLAAVFAASPGKLLSVHGVGKTIAHEIAQIDLTSIAEQIESWRQSGVAILTLQQDIYPELLRQVEHAPPTLFARGCQLMNSWAKSVAIVGTRRPSKEARYITLQLAMKLARADYTVVSGLALGIDTAAHAGALSAKGRTVGVLGSGVLNVYPESNRKLAGRVCDGGALLSEVHPHWGANAQRLVSRNRIISGLSEAVILVESDASGGAMYTTRFAQEQGRPVYTFDLPASGNQSLIRRGAEVLKRDDPLDFILG